jgi:Arylsulfotransferase (ASST)
MNRAKVTARLLFALWLGSVSLIALLGAFTLGAAMFRHIEAGGDKIPEPLHAVVTTLAEAPSLVKQAFTELRDVVTGRPSALLIPKDQVVKPGWKHQFPAPDDDGYLLLSGVSPEEKQSVVQLIRVADGHVMAKWVPDWNYIHSHIKHYRFAPKGNSRAYRAIHPLLLNDGSLIFNTGGSLVRLPLCSSKPSWVLDYSYHHSIELSSSEQSIWVPSVSEHFFVDNKQLKHNLRDDSLAEVNLDGKVLQNLSFSKILFENNLIPHLLGTTGLVINLDPIHINQITPAQTDSSYWKKDDLLISARHLSTIYLYRPSTGQIIWHKQGPWLNQHSVHFVNNHSIAIFSNHVYGANLKEQFIFADQKNRVYIFDFAHPEAEAVQLENLNKFEPKTITEGRAHYLWDKSLFIEETNNSRIFKFDSHGNLQWSYINYFDEKYLGALGWSRYLSKNEMKEKMTAAISKCGNRPLER